MYYVEYLFARNRFTWFASIAVAIGILALALVVALRQHIDTIRVEPGALDMQTNHVLPLSVIFGIAGYATCVMATMLTATLNRDRNHLPYIWTRPTPRERIALGYMLIDVVTIVVAYALVAGVATFIVANLPTVHLADTSETATSIVRYLALPLMWYALVEVATSWNAFRGGAAAGMSWAIFWGLLIVRAIVTDFPAPIPQIVAALNLLNPLAYFTTKTGQSITFAAAGTHTIPLDYSAQTVLAYAIFVTGCIVAIYAWKRMEA